MLKNKNLIGFVVIFLLGLISVVLAYNYLVVPRDVFYWDESHHAFYGLLIFDDLKSLNWDKFWIDTGKQTLWCFLHSWFLGIWFLLFGMSFSSARAMSLFFFFGSIILTYLIAIRINREKGWIIGIIASILMILSPIILDMASACMIEALSVFFALLFVFVYLIALEKQKTGYFFLVGITLGILTLTKYQYGALFGFAVAVLALWEFWGNREIIKEWFLRYLSFLLGAIIVTALWFLTPPAEKKIRMVFWSFEQAGIVGEKLSFFERIIDYPMIILNYYSFSYLIGILLFISLIYVSAYFIKKQINLRILVILIIIPLILSTIIGHHEARYISVFVPLMYVLFGFMLIDLFGKIKQSSLLLRRWIYVGGILVCLFLCYELFQFPQKAFSHVYNQYPVINRPFDTERKNNLEDVLNFFYDAIPPGESVSVGFSGHYLTPYNLAFHFNKRFIFYSSFMIKDPNFFKSRYFITVEVPREEPYYWPYQDGHFWPENIRWNKFLNKIEQEGKIKLYEQKEFSNLRITAKIYVNAAYSNKSWLK